MRVIEFVDGFESSTEPSISNIQANNLKVFANDAAFVTDKGSAAAQGDIYSNSTSDTIRQYNGTEWLNLINGSTSDITASKVPYIDANKQLVSSAVTPTELGYVSGVSSAIQTQLNTKAPSVSPSFTTPALGAATGTSLQLSGLTASRVLQTDASKNLESSSVTTTELGYVSGVTSAIQTQINTKAPSASPTFTGTVTVPATITSGSAVITLPTTTKTLATLDGSEVLTNKDIDGGTASNSKRITLPKDTTANLSALLRKAGTMVFDTTTLKPYFDNGTSLVQLAAATGIANLPVWATSTAYVAGDIIRDSTGNYVILCLTNHTSGTYATDVASGYWQMATPMKNYIINGNMVIDQRNAGAAVSAANTDNKFLVDRWQFSNSPTGKFNSGQNQGGLTPPSTFTKYFNLGCVSTYTPGASEYALYMQQIEGLIAADLGFGKSTAKPVTLSFRIYSTKTGTFGGAIANHNGTRSYPFTYVVNATNTWETKYITIAGDTAGTWNTDSSCSIKVFFDLGTGTTYKAAAGSWAAGHYVSATGASNWATNEDGFNITGVMLNEGPAPAVFQTMGNNYQADLAICQRYYFKDTTTGSQTPARTMSRYATTTELILCGVLPVPMRTAPVVTLVGTRATDWQLYDNSNVTNNTGNFSSIGRHTSNPQFSFSSGTYTAGVVYNFQFLTTSGAIEYSGEF